MLEVMRGNLCEAQNRMKVFADKHRTERSFEVGDEVYLKLHPYKQSSVQLRRNMKLAPKYYGPFRILAKIGPVAYRLALPPTSGIHPVFHVSLLKKKIGHKHTPTLNLPIFDQHGFCKVYPSQILARRLISRRNDPVPQVLVQWINYGPSEATWEDYYDLVARFPDFNMDRGGPGPSLPGSNVTDRCGNSRIN
ncbi:UNVERIFIED_CONTAM: hypothetical protein Sradi_5913100 [Sesamum radiatum]